MINNFEFEDKFNPWTVTSLDDFLFYCCPECDNRSVTKSEFVQHAMKNHPRSQNLIDSLEDNQELPKSVTESENNLTDSTKGMNINDDLPEDMEIEETKPEFTLVSSFVTKVNHELIKVESHNDPEVVTSLKTKTSIPSMKKAVVSLPRLTDKIIRKYTKDTEIENLNCSDSDNGHLQPENSNIIVDSLTWQQSIVPSENISIAQDNCEKTCAVCT